MDSAWRQHWPDALLGAGVVLVGLGSLWGLGTGPPGYDTGAALLLVVVVLLLGAAGAMFRSAPASALALVWAAALVQVAGFVGFTVAHLAVVLVAYGTGRHGSRATVWASGLSIPVAVVGALLYGRVLPGGSLRDATVALLLPAARSLPAATVLVGGYLAAAVLATAVLAVPWTAGLVLRLRESAARDEQQRRRAEQQRTVAEGERHQAEEIARLREEQTRLARDVHDVVGHSLAVILAQAESAQFRPESDTAAIRATLATIAVSARQSLRDVRDVLGATDGAAGASAGAGTGGLDALLDSVRAAGRDVRSTVVGTPRPLPPELEVVAFRVLQEMLTNALRHGARGEPVLVERHWEGELRLEVGNRVATPATGHGEPGEPGDPGGTDEDTRPLWSLGDAPAGAPADRVAHPDLDPLTDPGAEAAVAEPAAGRGLDGMRRRLESVGGRLDVRRREDADGRPTFTATAWVPLRAGVR